MVFSQVPMENLVHMEEFALPSCIRVLFILSNVKHQLIEITVNLQYSLRLPLRGALVRSPGRA